MKKFVGMIMYVLRVCMYGLSVFLMAIPLVSCGGSSGSSGGTGTLELSLTDAATNDYQAVYVTIAEVQVKKQGEEEGEAGWETVATPERTYNLLELVNGALATLGIGELEAGQYGQLRLILGAEPDDSLNILDETHQVANYLIKTADNSIEELKIPSGYQTGIKIVHGFTIAKSGATELILDFDAGRSVVQAGNSGQWLLKPTIKVLETVDNSISGVVVDAEDAPLAGALVSAQTYIPPAPDLDPEDEVTVESTTVTTEEGSYKLFLPPDVYNIVVTMEGYQPACQEVGAQFFEEYVADFSLVAETEFMSISGTVAGLATDEDSAILSIRQSIDCGSGNVKIEVASVRVANDTSSEGITLPVGIYDVVVSTEGEETQVFEGVNTDTELNIVFNL
jgi:hypothetical protein